MLSIQIYTLGQHLRKMMCKGGEELPRTFWNILAIPLSMQRFPHHLLSNYLKATCLQKIHWIKSIWIFIRFFNLLKCHLKVLRFGGRGQGLGDNVSAWGSLPLWGALVSSREASKQCKATYSELPGKEPTAQVQASTGASQIPMRSQGSLGKPVTSSFGEEEVQMQILLAKRGVREHSPR